MTSGDSTDTLLPNPVLKAVQAALVFYTSWVQDPWSRVWVNHFTETGSSCFFPSIQVSIGPYCGAAQLLRTRRVLTARPASTLIHNFALGTVICSICHADLQMFLSEADRM